MVSAWFGLALLSLLLHQSLSRVAAHSPPSPPSSWRIAVVSVATPDVVERYQTALNSKQCYCKLHDCTFVLDTNEYQHRHGWVPHWNRVPALKRLLPVFDWVVYMDADLLISDSHPDIRSLIHSTANVSPDGTVTSYPQLIVQDGMEINNGVFILQAGAWAWSFLDDWWKTGQAMRDDYVTTAVQDQAAMQELLLRHALEHRAADVQDLGSCAATKPENCYTQFSACWWIKMAELGFPLGRRSTPFVHYWHNGPGARAINSIFPLSVTALKFFLASDTPHDPLAAPTVYFNGWWYHPSRVWRPGDFTLHRVNERRGGAGVDSPRVLWSAEIDAMFDPFHGGASCPASHWTVGSPVDGVPLDAFGRNYWDNYVQAAPKYVPGSSRDAASTVRPVINVSVPLATRDHGGPFTTVQMPLELEDGDVSAVDARFHDILLLSGTKCAGDFVQGDVEDIHTVIQNIQASVLDLWRQEKQQKEGS